ncbi:hypothetical protein, partial [Streptomyces sp. wa1063]|uniref:hypothetical protein n=1 Tax=Streptomyces sp. wa1063 TaxID=1828212 RepID=UPI001C54C58E
MSRPCRIAVPGSCADQPYGPGDGGGDGQEARLLVRGEPPRLRQHHGDSGQGVHRRGAHATGAVDGPAVRGHVVALLRVQPAHRRLDRSGQLPREPAADRHR